MDNNLNNKENNEENIVKDEQYFKREVRKNNLAFFLSVLRFVLHVICLITIFADSVVGVSINLFSAYFVWVITIAVNYLNGTPIKHRFKIFEFKFMLALFGLVLLKSVF